MLLDRHPNPPSSAWPQAPGRLPLGSAGSASHSQSFPVYEAALRPPPILRQACEEEQELLLTTRS